MRRIGGLVVLATALILFAGLVLFSWGWYGTSSIEDDTPFIVPRGASFYAISEKLENEGLIGSAEGFRMRARFFGNGQSIKAGEFLMPAGTSPGQVLGILQSGNVIRRMITIPEGTPSILVHEKLMAEGLLTGEIPVPEEGSILPDTYDFERGETRAAVVQRMQAAMGKELAEAWAKRTPRSVVNTPVEALVLASIVEKETGVPSERRMVAGLYSNRVRTGMLLQADPTIIYPITKGKPLGRRIRQSEIAAINDYNTYSMVGLPKGPITNPGREAIAAVLNPEETSALYMVADGKGGHVFADTLQEHNANVERWFALRRERGEM